MSRVLYIQSADGQNRDVPLEGERMTLGRSRQTELCFADDAGLSRQHLMFENDGDEWFLQDLGSKNGSMLNGNPVRDKVRLKRGDRVQAGHLTILYDAPGRDSGPESSVVFVDGANEAPSTSTVVTNLEGALSDHTIIARPSPLSASGAAPAAAPPQNAKLVQTLFAVGKELTGERPLPELFKLILEMAIDAVGAQRGVLLSLEGEELQMRANKGEGFRISAAVRDKVIREKTSVLVRDTSLDEAFKARASIVEQRVRTLMAAPLQTGERITGLIYVDSPFALREFSKDDLNLLTVMANVAAVRIEHARLAEIERHEQLMAHDLSQAADIQRRYLPDTAPEVPGLQLAGYNVPCRTVGGDYFDFVKYADNRVAMFLGDVSGKGLPASMMMMGLQARVRVLAEDPEDVAALMTRLNRSTAANCPSNKFITFFFCVLDPGTGELVFANAGHNPPVLVRASGEIVHLEGGGPVLGILKSFPYQEFRQRLDPGDVLVIYSDGVTEANDMAGEEFGEDRLDAVLRDARHLDATTIMDTINQSLAAFIGAAPQADDLTFVVCKRV